MTVIIGIDPHKATHAAVAIDSDERPIARLQLTAGQDQTTRLLAWATPLGHGPDVGGRVRRVGWASCWRSSCSAPVSTSWTCHRP